MSYFGDILEDGDKRMDYEVEKPWKKDDLKMLTFKVKSAPKKGLSLSNGVDMVRNKSGGYDFKHKSEFKRAVDEREYKFVASNKNFEAELEWSPADFNKDGIQSSVDVEAKCTPAKNDWELKVEGKFGGMELGPVTPWTEVSLY
jgi:hypothetical protein